MATKRHKILFLCTEDWFFYSHFRPLAKAALLIKNTDVVLATTIDKKYQKLEEQGIRIVPIDFDRASFSLISLIKLNWKLFQLMKREKADIIHFISLKPIIIGGLAGLFYRKTAYIYHLTGQGYLTLGATKKDRIVKKLFFTLITFFLKKKRSWLMVENPDDISALQSHAKIQKERTTILGGAGINTNEFPYLTPPENDHIHHGFVGRMVWSKGVDVLIKALDLAKTNGQKITIDLYGDWDELNPRAVSKEQLMYWNKRTDVNWHGHTNDISQVWRKADIAIVPSRGGEGLPRALLEAASCGRPLIITDVPGCRRFVRDGIEGFVVPPENPEALAKAMLRLAEDKLLRLEMGKAARNRVLEKFTENHVIEDVHNVYTKLFQNLRD